MGLEFKKYVFLGGTCNGSNWRSEIEAALPGKCFNPVVEIWDERAQMLEDFHRKNDNYVLYCITPKMTGVYSIAEVVEDSNKRPLQTLFVVLETDGEDVFTEFQLKSLNRVKKLVRDNGAKVFDTLEEVVQFLKG